MIRNPNTQITHSRIRKLVELAYVIEPLVDKKDCTTRFVDLPGKTIYDFIISGLNVGEVFEDYAKKCSRGQQRALISFRESR